MTIPRPLLICGIVAFSAALTIGIPVNGTQARPFFLTEEPQMADLLKMGNYPATIELIDTPGGERVSVSRRTEAGNKSGSASPLDLDTFIVP